MTWWKRQLIIGVSLSLVLPGIAVGAEDPRSTSANYSMVESQVGGTGEFDSASSGYQFDPLTGDGGGTLGDSFVGNSASTNYQTNAGFNTTAYPALSLTINTPSVTLSPNPLSSTVASTGVATFSVLNYTSYGYVVTVIGSTLTHGASQIDALATDTTSSAGNEQFGFNLVANTSPVALGADPVQVPSPSFSFGVAGDGSTGTYGTTRPYTVPDKYRFVSGETIGSAPKSSGRTDYTLSFLANIMPLTPSGTYNSALAIVVTGTY